MQRDSIFSQRTEVTAKTMFINCLFYKVYNRFYYAGEKGRRDMLREGREGGTGGLMSDNTRTQNNATCTWASEFSSLEYQLVYVLFVIVHSIPVWCRFCQICWALHARISLQKKHWGKLLLRYFLKKNKPEAEIWWTTFVSGDIAYCVVNVQLCFKIFFTY